jgi:hypothetical protein
VTPSQGIIFELLWLLKNIAMKAFIYTSLLIVVCGCKTPGHITANPSDETFTSGTAGSAKMTTELPSTGSNNVVVKPDTSQIKMDSVEAKRPKH